MDKKYYTPNEVAELLMVSPITVRQWAQKGWLKAQITAGGHRRFLSQDIEQFAKERGLTLLTEHDNTLRILIVDDDTQLAGFLVELLTGFDTPVETEVANNGFTAGRKLQEFKPDIMLLDLMMPGMNGFDVCHQLKEKPLNKPLRIIAMTGFPTRENIDRIINAGAEICLAKPLDENLLLHTIGLTQINSI
ncbi:MAG: response regulator [Gammaproteobacteria bacterium]|nr:response regulator [Gammaproteobacteria bacterium]